MNMQFKLSIVLAFALTTSFFSVENTDAQIFQRGRDRLSAQQRLLQSVRQRNSPSVGQARSPLRMPSIVGGSTRTNQFRIMQNRGQSNGGLMQRRSPGIWKGPRSTIKPGQTYRYSPNGRTSGTGSPGIMRGTGKVGQRLQVIIPKMGKAISAMAPVINAAANGAAAGAANSNARSQTGGNNEYWKQALKNAQQDRNVSKGGLRR